MKQSPDSLWFSGIVHFQYARKWIKDFLFLQSDEGNKNKKLKIKKLKKMSRSVNGDARNGVARLVLGKAL